MRKFKFTPKYSKDGGETYLWAWEITSETREQAWNVISKVKQMTVDEMQKFIRVEEISTELDNNGGPETND